MKTVPYIQINKHLSDTITLISSLKSKHPEIPFVLFTLSVCYELLHPFSYSTLPNHPSIDILIRNINLLIHLCQDTDDLFDTIQIKHHVINELCKILLLINQSPPPILRQSKEHHHASSHPSLFTNQTLIREGILHNEFNTLLKKLRTFVIKHQYQIPTVFISNAWPIEGHKEEYWIQSFLKRLAQDLKKGGVVTYIDIIDSRYGYPIRAHLNRIYTSDVILLIGTPSLKIKLENDTHHMVKHEYNAIMNIIGSNKKLIPILLLGDYTTAFPSTFLNQFAIEDWRDASYLLYLKNLFSSIFNVNSSQYQKLWEPLEALHDNSNPPHNHSPTSSKTNTPPEESRIPLATQNPIHTSALRRIQIMTRHVFFETKALNKNQDNWSSNTETKKSY